MSYSHKHNKDIGDGITSEIQMESTKAQGWATSNKKIKIGPSWQAVLKISTMSLEKSWLHKSVKTFNVYLKKHTKLISCARE